jgi:hypothetical protein
MKVEVLVANVHFHPLLHRLHHQPLRWLPQHRLHSMLLWLLLQQFRGLLHWLLNQLELRSVKNDQFLPSHELLLTSYTNYL